MTIVLNLPAPVPSPPNFRTSSASGVGVGVPTAAFPREAGVGSVLKCLLTLLNVK